MVIGMCESLQMVNVKIALLRAKKAQKWELRYSSTLSLTSALKWRLECVKVYRW